MKYELSDGAKDLLDHYFSVRVGDWKVKCPYFMNVRKQRNLLIVYSGKGLPQEIEAEANKVLKSRMSGNKNVQDAKDFLVLCGLGVDCSGLVTNVLNIHFEETVGKTINQLVRQPNWLRKAISMVRPRTNISSELLTGDLNSLEVKLVDVKPGDLIRQGKRHVLLVEWVEKEKTRVKKFGYVESNTRPEWGVQRGKIDVTDPKLPLGRQQWEVEETWKKYVNEPDGGLVRLKFG